MEAPDNVSLLAEITWSQDGATTREQYLDALLAVLERLIPADAVSWNYLDFAHRRAVVYGNPPELYRGEGIARRVAAAEDDPMLRSYWADLMLHRADRPPRRLSDVIGAQELRATHTYRSLLHPLRAESQLSILTHQTGLVNASSWVFARDEEHDFTDAELAVAARIQPLLALVQRSGVLDETTDAATDAALEASVNPFSPPDDDFELTQRERQILSLLAHGLTAAAIGRHLRISDRTVRKHLENCYRKLHCNDRLVAVDRARAAGLLPKVPVPAFDRLAAGS